MGFNSGFKGLNWTVIYRQGSGRGSGHNIVLSNRFQEASYELEKSALHFRLVAVNVDYRK